MKKQFIAAALIAALGLTACGEAKTSEKTSEKATDAATTAEITTEAATEAATTAEITTEAATEAAVPTELSKTYADLDNRSFMYDGHLYTLGVSTLQDMLDNGVEFTETDNYDKMWDEEFNGQLDYNTFSCEIEVGSGRGNRLNLSFLKITDDAIPMRDCVLGEVFYTGLADEIASDFYSQPEFAFPRTMTPDELFANSGEPTSKEVSGHEQYYFYTVVSDKFSTEDSGYEFFYTDEEFSSVKMTWIP